MHKINKSCWILLIMNPTNNPFHPQVQSSFTFDTSNLTKTEQLILKDLLTEWTEIPTLALLLDKWAQHKQKNIVKMLTQQNLTFLLVNVASLNKYHDEFIELASSIAPPIFILNGTFHNDKSIKKLSSHFYNYNIFTMIGSNDFGGVLIALHKSIRTEQVKVFDNIKNLIVLEVGHDQDKFQLVTCYSPPSEEIPFNIFDQILARNKRTIFTGDLNAKHKYWSKSAENPKGHKLYNWLTNLQQYCSMDIVNKHVPTSTRSDATIDLFIAPTSIALSTFSVLPSFGSDHFPVIWYSPLIVNSNHDRYPIKRTRWKLFEIFLTFTGQFWKTQGEVMSHSATFFTLYERFLSLASARLTFISYQHSLKPSLPPEIVDIIKWKRSILSQFRKSRHPFFAATLREVTKVVRLKLFEHKRRSWESYCDTLNDMNVKAFWKKAKRHFKNKAESIEGIISTNNNITTSPAEMCNLAKDFYRDQFASHQYTSTNIEIEADETDRKIDEALRTTPPIPIRFTFDDIRLAFKSLKNKNSSGRDGVSNKILKLLPPNHLSTILVCMNNFSRTLCTPENWHIARIILLSKTK